MFNFNKSFLVRGKREIERDELVEMIINGEDITKVNYSKITNMSFLFSNNNELKSVPNLEVGNVTNMLGMFENCENLVDVGNIDTSGSYNLAYMFQGCRKLRSVPKFDTRNVQTAYKMFYGCKNLEYINMTNLSKIEEVSKIFFGCKSLKENLDLCFSIDKGHIFNMTNVLNIYNCFGLESLRTFLYENTEKNSFIRESIRYKKREELLGLIKLEFSSYGNEYFNG